MHRLHYELEEQQTLSEKLAAEMRELKAAHRRNLTALEQQNQKLQQKAEAARERMEETSAERLQEIERLKKNVEEVSGTLQFFQDENANLAQQQAEQRQREQEVCYL